MEKKENTLSGFEAIFDSLSFNTETEDDTKIDLNDVAEELTDEELQSQIAMLQGELEETKKPHVN